MEFLAVLEPSGEARTLSAGTRNAGFEELQKATFIGPSESGWHLFIDDEPLVQIDSATGPTWEWTPGFYAGTVTADLVDPNGRRRETFLLDVSPDPQKVGQEIFESMVEDIRAYDPRMLYGDEPALSRLGREEVDEDRNIQCSRMLRYAQRLQAAVAAVLAEPHRTLRSSRAIRPLETASRIDELTLRTALKSPAALDALDQRGSTETDDRYPVSLNVPVSLETFDSSANRCLLAILNSVSRRAYQLQAHFNARAETEPDNETRTSLAKRWPRRAQQIGDLLKSLAVARSKEPFRSVSRPEVSAAGLTAVAAHPLYARVQRLAWRILHSGYGGLISDDASWMSPTWEVYERWCFVQLCRALQQALPELAWVRIGNFHNGFALDGKGQDRHLVLSMQPTFSYRAPPPRNTGFWSLSSTRIPDIVLTIENQSTVSWFCLDAKYRRKRSNVVDAMESAHIYHDSLRRFADPPRKSLLLIPADGGDTAWLQEREFRERHGVGVFVLSRSNDAAKELVTELLAS